MRIGSGIDVHGFSEEPPLILGGVRVDESRGLKGHSDADVLTHAMMDAILGALSLGDIGKHFPPEDMKFKDAYSLDLLIHCYNLAKKKGYGITNIDCTIMAEKPKLAPYIDDIRGSISKAIDEDISKISVKATTFEGLGFVGRKEGIMAQATVLLYKK
ncbi:2-C-methyl-D-erythritol 2,4-cyclodiphosphate synthase [Natranaerofaba carboxydovora]|uniref:2-C-methyl-D-erythritol 2,4-cyclodiphosphate synthase n=1 Tax=Natranaerofaba carboxydovora TaxID=2742683 RepID=UPI001F143A71|nr:2-C-methyl-D-erythritol 2,4-cyclodiphosphate synthase [Natranaerofaba carboxydovora]UMZ75370.1 2-C-methyl-D-erythritol 2,4-cyclodiphosphate synthase [Natranaerofaba carboxydovora]